MKYFVKDISKSNVIVASLEEGQKVYDLIVPHLNKGEKVIIDFKPIGILSVVFLDAAFGQLLRDYKPSLLKELLIIENLSEFQYKMLGEIVRNAKRKYDNERKQLENNE